ncbi:hypothetical protein ABT359_36575, partial [Streptomyces rochei]|uniref:hypothetical protein n=1 Tax=Streptomyces rochei TaxID=1928 RepID=UPI00331FAC9E
AETGGYFADDGTRVDSGGFYPAPTEAGAARRRPDRGEGCAPTTGRTGRGTRGPVPDARELTLDSAER